MPDSTKCGFKNDFYINIVFSLHENGPEKLSVEMMERLVFIFYL